MLQSRLPGQLCAPQSPTAVQLAELARQPARLKLSCNFVIAKAVPACCWPDTPSRTGARHVRFLRNEESP